MDVLGSYGKGKRMSKTTLEVTWCTLYSGPEGVTSLGLICFWPAPASSLSLFPLGIIIALGFPRDSCGPVPVYQRFRREDF